MSDLTFAILAGKLEDQAHHQVETADDAHRPLWEIAAEAAGTLKARAPELEGLGMETLKAALDQWGAGKSKQDLYDYLAKKAYAEEIIAAVQAGTAELEAETARILHRNAVLLQVLAQVGKYGAKALMALLLAAV
jgi:hypothetical protein